MHFPSPRSLTPLLLAPLLVALAPRVARASEDLVVDTQGYALDGQQSFRTVTIKSGFTLGVIPTSKGKGWLHLRANRIVIEAGAGISATGAGFQGKEAAKGGGPGGGAFPTGTGADAKPGGGAGHAGPGGGGVDLMCAPSEAAGGPAYGEADDPDPANGLGSAGGAALAVGGGTRGGHGGGAILLEASTVQVDGKLEADGQIGLSSASGGGAGGALIVRAFALTIGTDAVFSVKGGNGGATAKAYGGGGSGGFATFFSPPPGGATKPDISGGSGGGKCTDPAAGAGAAGVFTLGAAPTKCFDLDGDGHTAVECGGDDCDDVDAAVHPAAAERCDGVDNDCSGQADDATPEKLCSSSLVCVEGACKAPVVDAGTDAAPPTAGPPPPDHLEFAGGCALASPRAFPPMISALVAMAALAALAARRRKLHRAARPEAGAPPAVPTRDRTEA